jgi:hypothetical protein
VKNEKEQSRIETKIKDDIFRLSLVVVRVFHSRHSSLREARERRRRAGRPPAASVAHHIHTHPSTIPRRSTMMAADKCFPTTFFVTKHKGIEQ